MSKLIFTCSKGYENNLENELVRNGFLSRSVFQGCIYAKSAEKAGKAAEDLCFPHFCMIDPVLIEGASVNTISREIAEKFFNINKTRKIESEWPFLILPNQSITGIGKRESAVEEQTGEYLRRIAGKIFRLAVHRLPEEQGINRGMILYFEDFDKVHLSSDFVWYGQKRVSDDPDAPSRSFMKVEEAYQAMGLHPSKNQTVCDLGAAPGGWSYSAAKKEAVVTAVDNGELKAGAKNNIRIARLAADAFSYIPDRTYDWLFCDMVEHPNMVLKLLEKWIDKKWCRYFIVNLKFGRVNPDELLEKLTSNSSYVKKRCLDLKVRHLFHDRDEITLMGRLE
ncbi:MAG TPA: SAM-dependent methyltransferase [Clostridiales bacterium]|jgi:23S rRNA (cytidine2498-2'-O)-methyltransferase|nr:SAM-dependent methyltransferase [Clostridiales bacterium]HQP69189.1 SAM-dependent methyltransferase [Clostridiales bacterium]